MDKSLYTDASVLNVANTVNSVDWNLPVSKQATVDNYVVEIRNAMNALAYKPADYSAVDAAMLKVEEAKNIQATRRLLRFWLLSLPLTERFQQSSRAL